MRNTLFMIVVLFGCYQINNKVEDRKRQFVYATIWSAFVVFICFHVLVSVLKIG